MSPAKDEFKEVAATVKQQSIGSFAVFDLETSNLPDHDFNRVSITELCIYGFVVNELENVQFEKMKNKSLSEEASTTTATDNVALPVSPRVLHKLTLLLNPRRMIDQEATQITGLDNFILEHESPFNENAANTVLGFLQHLQQPVCLVAHNGIKFDFPIVKQSFEKLKMHLPYDMLCIDSIHAFQDIDEQRSMTQTITITPTTSGRETLAQEISTQETIAAIIKEEEEVEEKKPTEKSPNDWRIANETTPKRPPATAADKELRKRRLLNLATSFADTTPDAKQTSTAAVAASEHSIRNGVYKSRRALFTPYGNEPQKYFQRRKRYSVPYSLVKTYERIFRQAPNQSHYAEADVDSLMKLMQHYGNDFLAYAENHAIPLAEVPKLGAKS